LYVPYTGPSRDTEIGAYRIEAGEGHWRGWGLRRSEACSGFAA
jgi:hypothetical protein